MADLLVREKGPVGWITLNRPEVLNALTHEMCRKIEQSLDLWEFDDNIRFIIIDAVGEKAFCAGGDIIEMYKMGKAGNFAYGHAFWRDEYRLNAKIYNYYPKPIVSFLQGYTMGGGVGIGCLGQYRIVGESSKIAMPECTVGLVPDVGGSYILANAPNYLGEYFGLTGTRMNLFYAILVGFANFFIPEKQWNEVKEKLFATGDIASLDSYFSYDKPPDNYIEMTDLIDRIFSRDTLGEIEHSLLELDSDWSNDVLKKLYRNSPLSLASTLYLIRRQRSSNSIEEALDIEFRFTYRSAQYSDFIEGIRAQVIDKDFKPRWKHKNLAEVTIEEVAFMFEDLKDQSLDWKGIK